MSRMVPSMVDAFRYTPTTTTTRRLEKELRPQAGHRRRIWTFTLVARALASLGRPDPRAKCAASRLPRAPSILRIAFCSLPSAWSALPSACFLSGCAARPSAAGADHSYGTQTV